MCETERDSKLKDDAAYPAKMSTHLTIIQLERLFVKDATAQLIRFYISEKTIHSDDELVPSIFINLATQ